MKEEIEKILAEMDLDPHRPVTCGDVAGLIRAVRKVGDEQTAQTIQVLIAFVAGCLQRVAADRDASITLLAQQVKGYVDGKVEIVEQAVAEVKQTTWN